MVENVVTSGGRPIPRMLIGIDFEDPELARVMEAQLLGVEAGLRHAVESVDPLLDDVAHHLVSAGGKRIRPLLVGLAAQFGTRPACEEVTRAGVVVELTHLATLYHDDVMDEAPVRRGAPSANLRWSNSIAILAGDHLFARAADLAVDLGLDAVRLQARTFSRLVYGQIAETSGPRDRDPIEHHLDVIAEKTGSLIGTSAKFGAMFSNATPQAVDALAEYGEVIGIAFQLSDDLLDIASESAQSGKTPGTDLREGVATLPVLYALADESTDDAGVARLRELLSKGPLTDDAELTEALELLRESTAMKRARETVRGYAERARALLDPLPDIPARRALAALADLIADRTS
ncbi:polyprenyl synthetase family protein [Luedemannella flava]|uniref:Polyprenyl synthetase family protein n=2 Tax=Luedemannella flava TaxID=349316 RepID=A0ABP4YVL3_9ACTN